MRVYQLKILIIMIVIVKKQSSESVTLGCNAEYIGIRKWILKSLKIILLEFDRSQTFSEGHASNFVAVCRNTRAVGDGLYD